MYLVSLQVLYFMKVTVDGQTGTLQGDQEINFFDKLPYSHLPAGWLFLFAYLNRMEDAIFRLLFLFTIGQMKYRNC